MSLKVAIGISGGIDSAVAAFLLKKAGYQVTGVYLKLTDYPPAFPPEQIAKFIGIPYMELDLRNEFKKMVIDYFIKSYLSGVTPNPCVRCNQYIKLGIFVQNMRQLGFDLVATGHYARKAFINHLKKYCLLKGKDLKKEQSYFLCMVSQDNLSYIIWPLGNYLKDEVKEIASINGFPNKNLKESQEICFIPNNDYRRFLSRHLPNHFQKDGPILNTQGEVIGRHQGLWNYTIGQRKGLGICYKVPLYVKKIDVEHNALIVTPLEELLFQRLVVKEINLIHLSRLQEGLKVSVKVRYQHQPAPAVVLSFRPNEVVLGFKQPQFGVTPGQFAAFYQGEICLGGGVIYSAQ